MKNNQIKQVIKKFVGEMKGYESTYLGFPNNMDYDYKSVSHSAHVYINNAGDPFSTLSWKKHSKHFEQEVVHFFLDLYKLPKKIGWGYITSGGTEGNMEGLFLAREAYPDATVYYSEDTHYSIGKIVRLLRMKSQVVKSQGSGEIDYVDLDRLLKVNENKQAIMLVNCGTTVKGAFDDLSKIKKLLKKNKVEKVYIHVDGALSGMITPFIEKAPFYSFDKGIDSIAISMHKFLGVPMISGIVIVKKHHVEKVKTNVEYINSLDTTIAGSRNGHSSLYTWYAIQKYGSEKFKSDAQKCLDNAKYLHLRLNDAGYTSQLNAYSNTVYFAKPNQELVEKWQLSCFGGISHVVVMQHVNRKKIDYFMQDMIKSHLKMGGE